MKDFIDFWGRAGLPASQRLHAIITWNTALDALVARAAKELKLSPEQLQAVANKMKGDSTEGARAAAARVVHIPGAAHAQLLDEAKKRGGRS